MFNFRPTSFCSSAAPSAGGLANYENSCLNAPSRGERSKQSSQHLKLILNVGTQKLISFMLYSCNSMGEVKLKFHFSWQKENTYEYSHIFFSLSNYSKQRSNHSQMDLESYIKAEVDLRPGPWMSIIPKEVKADGGKRNTEVEPRSPMSMDKLSVTLSWLWKNTYECFYISSSLRQIPKQRPYFSLMNLVFKNRTEVSQRSRLLMIMYMNEVKTDRGSRVTLAFPRSVKSLKNFLVFENTNLEIFLKKLLATYSLYKDLG